MKHRILFGAMALGLVTAAHAEAPAPAPTPDKAPAPVEATTPPVAVTPGETPAADKTPAAPAADKAAPTPPLDPKVLKNDSSFALGYRTGANFAQQFGRFGVTPGDLDSEAFMKGFMNAFNGQQPEIEAAKLEAAMEGLRLLLESREKVEAAANLEKGKKFLEENGKRPGVITNPSGLQYEILAKGGAEKYVAPKEGAEDNKEFLVNYKGTLIDGTEFDASPAGQPVPMTLQVVPGFREALTTMPVGAKWKLYLPAPLAYGDQRTGPKIAPNSTLVFELELVKIQDAPAQNPGMPFPMPMPEEQ